jgi:hypothetical protein
MNLFFKKTSVPVSNEMKEVDAVQLWQVTWWSRHGEYSSDLEKEFEVFTSEKEANEFAEALRAAYKLVRHTSRIGVNVEKRQ